MAWDQLDINKPHLAYSILGGFTALFMLCSLFIKEKLYIGESTVATICGIIFGPKGANLFNPNEWGNVDQITLECSRIVLVVQCFAVGVELPKRYMTRHWKSIVILLLPVMTFGWLICSLFIWWMIPSLTWLESLCCAACITATDPVLASSVVGKGKFAKRVPKHLRDLLSAESGCNDGMAFPFIYLSLYIIKYKPHAGHILEHWIIRTVLYECIFGAVYGVAIGYAGRHAIKFAERKNLIDRESFLVFYFVLALFCAGTGSMLGLDDLLVGFCAGVAFSNDGWFSQQTEDSHVSNVIDLLLNLAFFVYFGSIIPWSSYNRPDWEITPWRLVVISILVLFFRRIPIMLALKPLIPDIKTWREALFAGHFGPIGVGAIFVAILARAKLETGESTPLAVLPPPGSTNYLIIELIWPITTFLIITSIIVHGSSVAVFTLGKRINTMRITMSYTIANEEPNWLSRLPRLTPRPSMARKSMDESGSSDNEKAYPSGTLPPPGGIPGGFLSRRPAEDDASSAITDESRLRRRGPGGPISDSAIHPQRTRTDPLPLTGILDSTTRSRSPSPTSQPQNIYQEGGDVIVEDREGNVIAHTKTDTSYSHHLPHALDRAIHPHEYHSTTSPSTVPDEHAALAIAQSEAEDKKHRRRPAWAYRFDDNVIVEDADGEVIRRYKLSKEKRPQTGSSNIGSSSSGGIPWATSWTQKFLPKKLIPSSAQDNKDNNNPDVTSGDDDNEDAKTIYSVHRGESKPPAAASASTGKPTASAASTSSLSGPIHWRMHDEHGRRLSKHEFLEQLKRRDPHARTTTTAPQITIAVPPPAATSSVNRPTDMAARIRASVGAQNFSQLPTTPKAPAVVGDEETAVERRRREAALGISEEGSRDDEEERGGKGRRKEGELEVGEPLRESVSKGIRFAPELGRGSEGEKGKGRE